MSEPQHTQTERGERCSCGVIHPVVCGGIVLFDRLSVYNSERATRLYEDERDEWGIEEDE